MTDHKKIFIDTSAWVELWFINEIHTKEIQELIKSETKLGSIFLTSDYVLDETFTRLITAKSFQNAKRFYNKIIETQNTGNLTILWTDKRLFSEAWEWFEKFSEHKLSFTDATIYTFVKNLKIDEVLTLDQGFKKVGLVVKPDII
ncbi:hypothetical protein A3D00_00805 [Candidatus Woesebacteria bacterium RIFCSPHIGHO2_02_FULL_38_9]|uniref:PIN domain-containing protein n=1 Tax=Candidatus Woesebacteria bacterium RIFCSPHIGHO2_01_FULL_39_28 TaxID=1802496 RepID=A0A1F7Y8S1_9BACT|nr:MAG: hypothetical protein A2627_02130 [Candidatus Woesebacteria bacterium RIFCSPHIGHO2_01_FULL_39_28]OGM33441.1 MAG: hypothetical protein A3D00_00805 [Candidatus Woesebacteria bacterium RIFCSPHIGHO2_02_FULL_38_9]OGM57267.1 MAG: hypothetical protein A3A50_00605 [Candidatus Woesebacteria bacterium RIFCSPLOWO2_01_FULL_38_20]